MAGVNYCVLSPWPGRVKLWLSVAVGGRVGGEKKRQAGQS